jgi:hypothetical protein
MFCHQHRIGTPCGTTIINKNNDAILKANVEDLPDDQRTLNNKAAEEL